ncbi:MAG: sodium:solute symporter family protein [Planctomycetota bacterium]
MIIGLYIILLYAISFFTARLSSKGGMVGYFLAGRGLPMGVTAVMLAGLAVGGASTVGVAQRAYTFGISAGWYNAAWAFGAVIMGLLAAARYRKMEVSTLPELFERHYGTSGRVLGVFGQLVIQVVITSLQYVAGGAILSALLPELFDFQTGMFVTAGVFIGITLIGGLWAAGITNIINVILIYVGVVTGAVLLFSDALDHVGGFENLTAHLQSLTPPNPGFELGALGAPLIVAWFLIMISTALGTQAVVQISFASKTPAAARGGFLLGGLIILPVGFISALIGIAAAVFHPGLANTAEALPLTVLDLHPVLAGLILAGLWAADVSTACGLLLGSATLVVGDIIKRFFTVGISERGEWWLSRGAVLLLSVITLLLALFVKDILTTLLAGLTLNTAYALITLMTLFFPRLCRKGSAVWTLALSMLSLGAWFLFPAAWQKAWFHPIYFVLPVTLLTFLVVTVVDRRPVKSPDQREP